MKAEPIRVVLADDHDLVRAGFAALLDAQSDIVVVGEVGDGAHAVTMTESLRPDVVLMDIRMPVLDGLQATHRITANKELAGIHVVVLTTFELDEYVFQALQAGASGFLVKRTEPADLLRAVRVVVTGDALLSPSVTRRLVSEFTRRAKDPVPDHRLSALTGREREVLGLVAAGLANDEIADRLVLSPATVKTHVSRVLSKLEAHDRAQLVVLAYETGVVRPGWNA